jgi:type IV pilus assembly protein PilN
MRLTINLATRRYLNLSRLNAWLVACGLLLGVLFLFELREVAYDQGELGRVRAASAAIGSRPAAGPTVSPAQLKTQEAKIRFANQLIEKKSENWLKLLDFLEEVVPEGVALSQIEPDKHEQLLKVSGVARNFDNVRELLENMEQSKNFSEVYLLSQNDAKVGLTQRGIVFAVSCKVAGP